MAQDSREPSGGSSQSPGLKSAGALRIAKKRKWERGNTMITNIGHVAYTCKDLDKTLDFYCEKLGFQKLFNLKNEDGSIWIQYVKIAEDQFLEFFPEAPGCKPYAGQSYRHIALQTDDIRAEVERLRQLGVTIDREVEEGLDGSLQAWITDPDGNPIELMQLTEKSLQRTSR